MKLALNEVELTGKVVMQLYEASNLSLALSLFVVYDSEIILFQGNGEVEVGGGVPPDLDTVYNVGSVTKVFTGNLLAAAQRRGAVSNGDDLTKFFNEDAPPAWRVRNPYKPPESPLGGVTLEMLSSHTSGLPREAPCGVYCSPSFTTDLVFQYLNKFYNVMNQPFAHGHYSNLGFSLLGHAVARGLGVPYEDALVDLVLLPLNMTRSGFNYTTAILANMATGYTINPTDSAPYEQQESVYNTVSLGFSAPAGGMFSTPRNLAAYMTSLFRSDLSAISHETTGQRGPAESGHDYALYNEGIAAQLNFPDGLTGYSDGGWEPAFEYDSYVFTKGGLVDGFASSIAVEPVTKLGVGALVNFPDGGGMSGLTAQMMQTLLPAVQGILRRNQDEVAPLLPDNYETFVGTYGGILEVRDGEPDVPPGFLAGDITFYQTPLLLWWDPSQDYELGDKSYTAFRYRPRADRAAPGEKSCAAISGLGMEAVLYFNTF
eukprot:CAMPEP_0119152158 /NCGR_PEP_ID=MMETSP1310-20130426/47326_1 /TAXON_ID=464262 /ORGANISM="Genus nov. species nov., Strain RCC2339" /LENGTH=486 /DNA_ID=CAMNT_0007144495 /DNA_START=280 /DNA_END=1737 /DNA_ORIENTATION=-